MGSANPPPLNGGRDLFVIFLLFLNYSIRSEFYFFCGMRLPKKWNSVEVITRIGALYYGILELKSKNLKNCSFYCRPHELEIISEHASGSLAIISESESENEINEK